MAWTLGSSSASETLTDNDSLYPAHINELRTGLDASVREIVNVKDYGALGDGITDDITSIQTAMNVGGYIYFPAGTYLVSDKVKYVSNSYITGAGRGKTIIKLKNGTNPVGLGFLFQHNGVGGVPASGEYSENVLIEHLSIDGNKANNTGIVSGITVSGTRNGALNDVEAYNCSEVGIVVSSTFATDNINHGFNIGSNCYSYNNDADGIQLAAGILVGCRSYDNTGGGIRVVATYATLTKQPYAVISACSAFRNTSHGIYADSQSGLDQFPAIVTGCSSFYNTQDGIAWVLEQGVISNNLVSHNGEAGIRVSKDSITVTNNIVKNNGRVGATYTDGIKIQGDRLYLNITGNRVYDDQSVKTQLYGISEGASTPTTGNTNIIANNILTGNSTGALTTGLISRNLTYRVTNNVGYNPVGLSAITVGASPYTYTAGISPETIYIRAGTVSAVVKGGVTMFVATGCTISLLSGEAVVVTYSSIPTMIKDIS